MQIPFAWQACATTHVGRKRKYNEDAVFEDKQHGLWAVADGMGGHSSGDVASSMIVQKLQELDHDAELATRIDQIEDNLLVVNRNLQNMARERSQPTTIGSTIAALLLHKCYFCYLWAGDSRVYRMRERTLRQLTVDHSQVEQYIEQGLINREEAMTHPHSNMITRAVGVTKEFYLDMEIQELQPGDRFLLCSDGLNKHVDDVEIEELLRGPGDVQKMSQRLSDMTLERGAVDNFSIILVDIEKAP